MISPNYSDKAKLKSAEWMCERKREIAFKSRWYVITTMLKVKTKHSTKTKFSYSLLLLQHASYNASLGSRCFFFLIQIAKLF